MTRGDGQFWTGGGGGGGTTVGTTAPPAAAFNASGGGGGASTYGRRPGRTVPVGSGGSGGGARGGLGGGRALTPSPFEAGFAGGGNGGFPVGGSGGIAGANGRGVLVANIGLPTGQVPSGGASGAALVTALRAYGNGGAGRGLNVGASSLSGGAGGGGGAYIPPQRLEVTPGQVLYYVVAGGGGAGGNATNGGDGAVLFEWLDPPNEGPSVMIGTPSQSVTENEEVELVTTAADPDGTITSYAWTANLGMFDSPTAANPTWTAPRQTAENQTVTLAVTVTDNLGATAMASVDFIVQGWDKVFANGKQATAFYLNGERIVKFYFDGRPFSGSS